MKNIAIFASGEGSNAQNIIDYFKSSTKLKVALVVSNKPEANVLIRAKNASIPTLIIDRESFYKRNDVIKKLKSDNIDLIILAGFLWLVPESLIEAFPQKIINIHPSLLPKFGGKGMYGMNVHEAVIAAREKESGISIHYVSSEFDKGEIIAQHKCVINIGDDAKTVAQKIHVLEKEYFPVTIEKLL